MKRAQKVSYVRQFPEMAALLDAADAIDIKTVETPIPMREFIAGMLSYQPAWVTFLYRLRALFVRFAGIKSHFVPKPKTLRPDDVSMTPGAPAYFFRVLTAEEDRFWIARVKDSHLDADFGVVREPLGATQSRFYVITLVYYHNRIGRFYFNFIRPVHHLVVKVMINATLKRKLPVNTSQPQSA